MGEHLCDVPTTDDPKFRAPQELLRCTQVLHSLSLTFSLGFFELKSASATKTGWAIQFPIRPSSF